MIPCVKGWLCNETLTYAAGGDDRRILLWDVQRVLSDNGLPAVMKGEHHSNIFCVAFNNSNTKIFSGGESAITLVLFAATLLQLRSASSGVLVVPCTRTSTGQRSFAVNGPRTWNSLPAALRSPDLSLRSFQRQLKSYLFPHGGCQVPEQPYGAIVTVQYAILYNRPQYHNVTITKRCKMSLSM